MTLFPSRADWEGARTAGLNSTPSEDMQTGELEVCLLRHGDPELVDDGYRRGDWQADPRPHLLVSGMRGLHRDRCPRPASLPDPSPPDALGE